MKIDHKPGDKIMAVTGANGRQVLLNREERETLLRHLLEAEGLPTLEDLMLIPADRQQLTAALQAELERLSGEIVNIRQARLCELLEAEARERVEAVDCPSGGVDYKIDGSVWVSLTGNTYKTRPEARNSVLPIGRPANLEGGVRMAACLAAALAEKRRREAQDA